MRESANPVVVPCHESNMLNSRVKGLDPWGSTKIIQFFDKRMEFIKIFLLLRSLVSKMVLNHHWFPRFTCLVLSHMKQGLTCEPVGMLQKFLDHVGL